MQMSEGQEKKRDRAGVKDRPLPDISRLLLSQGGRMCLPSEFKPAPSGISDFRLKLRRKQTKGLQSF